MAPPRIVIVGAGIGGLSAAAALAHAGCAVTVLERAAAVGGKMREVRVADLPIDSGPTVLTMRWALERVFAAAGTSLDAHVALDPLAVLARHAWDDGGRLDLFADADASADAIAAFACAREAEGFRGFLAEARRIYATLRGPFLERPKPNPVTLSLRVGLHRLDAMFGIRPFDRLWDMLSAHFQDARLRQLFGRYATYCGASPFAAPATLALIAAVEQDGVWTVRGGMQRVAEALARVAQNNGAAVRTEAEAARIDVVSGRAAGVTLADGEHIPADAVICNTAPEALAAGLFGQDVRSAASPLAASARSLSALTWSVTARTQGFSLLRHTVFFSADYPREFAELAAGRLPSDPTVYVCAQDQADLHQPRDADRLLVLVNAPARADTHPPSTEEIARCQETTFARLRRCGLTLEPLAPPRATTPSDFATLFPGTAGALYGRASHGWAATFQRPGARTAIPGLILAGGGTHPGPGVPMAALSGLLAAQAALARHGLTQRSRPAATPGGTSTR